MPVIDSRRLIENYFDKIKLSPINSGSAMWVPQPRCPNTFKVFENYPWEQRKKCGEGAVAKLCVPDKIEDIANYVEDVWKIKPGN